MADMKNIDITITHGFMPVTEAKAKSRRRQYTFFLVEGTKLVNINK